MTEDRLPLAELLAKAGDGDFLRSVAEAVVQLLMETDVEGLIGAGRHERSGDRTTYRNGYRDRTLDTRLGSLQLRIPKLRQGSYFPPFLEPRKTSEKALVAVIQEAWVGGVSTRRVDDLVQAMGLAGISKSTVSKLCKDIDDRVNAFLDRPLAGEWPYLWLDATYLKQREGGRIVSVAAIIAVAANTEGKREIVGLHIGPSEAETFWATFLKSMAPPRPARREAGHLRRARGAEGGDPPGGRRLVAALPRALDAQRAVLRAQGAAEHGCRPPCARRSSNPIARMPARRCAMSPTSFGRSGRSSARSSTRARPTCWRTWTSQPSTGPRSTFTNPLERLNKEVKRRADVVGIFPNESAIVRLIGAVLLEANDEWQLQHRYMQTEAMAELTPPLTRRRCHPIFHRSRMIRGHLSYTPISTTLTDVTVARSRALCHVPANGSAATS